MPLFFDFVAPPVKDSAMFPPQTVLHSGEEFYLLWSLPPERAIMFFWVFISHFWSFSFLKRTFFFTLLFDSRLYFIFYFHIMGLLLWQSDKFVSSNCTKMLEKTETFLLYTLFSPHGTGYMLNTAQVRRRCVWRTLCSSSSGKYLVAIFIQCQ